MAQQPQPGGGRDFRSCHPSARTADKGSGCIVEDIANHAESREAISDREREIIVCLVQGLSNKEIADRLCISIHTVITHRRNIARKLQIHSLAGLTLYAIANNLIDRSIIFG